MARRVTVFLLALFVTYVLAASAATQSVLMRLREMGIRITLDHRLSATGHDLIGMATSFLPLLALGLLLAFVVTGWINRWFEGWRVALYVLAGAVAVIAVHAGLKLALDITPVAAARTTGGLMIQAAAGAAGGLIYGLSTNAPGAVLHD
ncbi:MAG: hypothetical protein KJO54_02275 [Gammaproteobacteria bacterium]|nr:hypothetical protein [Gammaproteobacteria bacterium]NNF61315.1 hypothetical protein [Gammaproteobacteria bacterium]NNM20105.1 hypothetical protein [Gammaproteobacteria bacterium]